MPGNDEFTEILLHMDGADGGTTFPDNNIGGSAHTWTANGNAQIDTAQSKFGGSSLLLDGAGDYITTPDHADFNLGSGNFTFDLWFNRAGGDGTIRVMGGQVGAGASAANSSISIALSDANVVRLSVSNGSSFDQVTGTTTFTATGWHHAAGVRTGNTLKLFVDGVQEGGDLSFNETVPNSDANFSIGRSGDLDGVYWNGWIDEVRFSRSARWTANFTPQAYAYGPMFEANAGSFSFSGKAVDWRRDIHLAALAESYHFAGYSTSLRKTLFSARKLWVPRRDPILVKRRVVEPSLED